MRAALIAGILCMIWSCTDNKKHIPAQPNSSTAKNEVTNADHFALRRSGNSIELTVFNPSEIEEDTYYYRLTADADSRHEKEGNEIQIPVDRVVCLSTTHTAMLSAIGAVETIAGISGCRYIYNTKMNQRIDSGLIREIGEDENPDLEKILALKPDVVFVNNTGTGSTERYSRLAENGIAVVVVADYMETTPLGLAEWVKFFGAFTGCDDSASHYFSNVSAQYNQLSELVRKYGSANSPRVFSGFNWRGTWSIPGGKSFAARYFADAGASYCWMNDTNDGKLLTDFETVLRQAAHAEFWVNPGSAATLNELITADERLMNFEAVRTGSVFTNDKRMSKGGGYDYFESGVVNPHIILADLISIFHPELLWGRELVYFRKLE